MAKKVLVVDNDIDYVAATESLLQAKGYATVSALDGNAGFDIAVAEKPDVILLDVMMRHVSEGLDLAAKLRDDARTAGIPVLLLTGIRKPDFLTASYGPGESWPNVRGTMEKPVNPETLFALLEKASA